MTKTKCPEPGIYFDIPDADYRAWDCPSQSLLSAFRDPENCELDIYDTMTTASETSDAMQLGLDIEAAIDGKPVRPNVQCLPDEIKQRRGKEWEALKATFPAVEFLPKSEYKSHGEHIAQVMAVANAVKADKKATWLLDGAKRQVSFVWDAKFVGMTGEEVTHRVKGRLDYWKPATSRTMGLDSCVGHSISPVYRRHE